MLPAVSPYASFLVSFIPAYADSLLLMELLAQSNTATSYNIKREKRGIQIKKAVEDLKKFGSD